MGAGLVKGTTLSLQQLTNRALRSIPRGRFLDILPHGRGQRIYPVVSTELKRVTPEERERAISEFYREIDVMPLWRELTEKTLEEGVYRHGVSVERYFHDIPYAALVRASEECLLLIPIYHHRAVAEHPNLSRSQLVLEAGQNTVSAPFLMPYDRNMAAVDHWAQRLGIANDTVRRSEPYIVKVRLKYQK